MHQNGFRPDIQPPQIKIISMTASVMVECICKNPMLLPFIPGSPLNTSCGKCKRKLSLGAISVDNTSGQLQVACAITDPPILEPTMGEVIQLGKSNG